MIEGTAGVSLSLYSAKEIMCNMYNWSSAFFHPLPSAGEGWGEGESKKLTPHPNLLPKGRRKFAELKMSNLFVFVYIQNLIYLICGYFFIPKRHKLGEGRPLRSKLEVVEFAVGTAFLKQRLIGALLDDAAFI